MTFDLQTMWESMGFLARTVAVALLVMGLATVAVIVERFIVLWRSTLRSRAFARELGPLIARGAYADAARAAAGHGPSHLAQLIGAGLRTYVDALPKRGEERAVELCKRELSRRLEALGANLRRGLGVLASVGSVAPFVGLFGTVVGIISAFHGIAATGSGGISSVAGGIAEALIVTGLGLAVAVPAVLMFNYLSTRCDTIERALGTAASELVDHLEHGDAAPGSDQEAAAETALSRDSALGAPRVARALA